MTVYSQRDSKWASEKLSLSSTSTIGNFGCTITCIGMLADLTPSEVNQRLKAVGGFSGELVIWSKIKDAIPWLEFEWRGYTFDQARVDQAVSDYGLCLVEVDFDGQISSPNDRHWVAYKSDGQLIDPWTGAIKSRSYYSVKKGYAVIKKVTPPVSNQVITDDEKRALTLLSEYQKTAQLGNLEGSVRDLVGKAGDLKQAIGTITSLKTDLTDRENFIQGQKATIAQYQANQDDLAGKLGVASEYPVIRGEVDKLVKVEDELDNTRRLLESERKKNEQLQASSDAISEFRMFGLLFRVYRGG